MQRISAVCLSYQLRFIEQTPGFFTESVKTWKIFLRSAQTQRHLNFKRPKKKRSAGDSICFQTWNHFEAQVRSQGTLPSVFLKKGEPPGPYCVSRSLSVSASMAPYPSHVTRSLPWLRRELLQLVCKHHWGPPLFIPTKLKFVLGDDHPSSMVEIMVNDG